MAAPVNLIKLIVTSSNGETLVEWKDQDPTKITLRDVKKALKAQGKLVNKQPINKIPLAQIALNRNQ